MSKYISSRIVPAILPSRDRDLVDGVCRFKNFVPLVQIDVCDGELTPKASWPYRTEAAQGDLQKLVDQEEGLPFWQDINFEIDLMVVDPAAEIDKWIMAGAECIVLHPKRDGKYDKETLEKILEELSSRGVFAGLAVHLDSAVEDDISYISEIRDRLDLVQVMGIANVGFQSQDFDPRSLVKVQAIRDAFPDLTISVDGAVTIATALDLIDAGASRLVVGHDLIESIDVAGEIHALDDCFE